MFSFVVIHFISSSVQFFKAYLYPWNLGGGGRKNQRFKVILNYIVSLRLAWATFTLSTGMEGAGIYVLDIAQWEDLRAFVQFPASQKTREAASQREKGGIP